MRLDTFNEETVKDPNLTAVINAILSSDWQVKVNVDTKTLRTLYTCVGQNCHSFTMLAYYT